MKVELNIIERMLVEKFFAGLQGSMSVEKIQLKDGVIDQMRITDEEKEQIDWQVSEGPARQVGFDAQKAQGIINEYELTDWCAKLIRVWLTYSSLLDDMQASHYTLYSKFVKE